MTAMRAALGAPLFALSWVSGTMAFADEQQIAFGEYLAGECVSCHQLSGAANGIPPIVGWEPPRFVLALKEYRAKSRPNEAMRAIASRLEDEELAALAAYFATQKQQQ
jgi:cytochrome c553